MTEALEASTQIDLPKTPLESDFAIEDESRPQTATPKASGYANPDQVQAWREQTYFPMSPDEEQPNPFEFASSPPAIPFSSGPSPALTRRTSTGDADASFADLSLAPTEQSSVISDGALASISEIDQKLEQFILLNEPPTLRKFSISDLPEDVPENLKHQAFNFHCAFGWDGIPEDLEDTPKTKKAFLEKLQQEKDGLALVQNSLTAYQAEINSRRAHKFSSGFLQQQNIAIISTMDQLDHIESKVDVVVEEVKAIREDDKDIAKHLVETYRHVAPWIRRTNRIVNSNHIFYKINYTMGVKARREKKLRRRVLPSSTPVVSPTLD